LRSCGSIARRAYCHKWQKTWLCLPRARSGHTVWLWSRWRLRCGLREALVLIGLAGHRSERRLSRNRRYATRRAHKDRWICFGRAIPESVGSEQITIAFILARRTCGQRMAQSSTPRLPSSPGLSLRFRPIWTPATATASRLSAFAPGNSNVI